MVSDPILDKISVARQEYRRRWRFFWFVFFTYLPLSGLFVVLNLFKPAYFAVAWMALFLIAGLRLGFFRCPTCQKLAFQKPSRHNPFSGKCLHCGFRLR